MHVQDSNSICPLLQLGFAPVQAFFLTGTAYFNPVQVSNIEIKFMVLSY